MKNTINILFLILFATFSLSSFACAGGKTTENNICENLEKEQACMEFIKSISDSKTKINYYQITAYTEKDLEHKEAKWEAFKESLPSGSIGNAWVWSDSGNSLARASTGNQLNYSVNFKPFNITSQLLLGDERDRLKIASAREKIDEAAGNLYSDDKTMKAQAYIFLKRIIKNNQDNECLLKNLEQCFHPTK